MAIDPAIRKRIIKNALLSTFIYALPVIALFVYLKISGDRPWENKNIKAYSNQIDKYKEGTKKDK